MPAAARRAALGLLALATACSHVGVTPAGNGVTAAARSPGCNVEFFRTKPPERPYDELATLHWEGTWKSAEAAQEDLRAQACALGADAVVVTRDYIPYTQNATGVMTVAAIKYRAAAAAPTQAGPGAKI